MKQARKAPRKAAIEAEGAAVAEATPAPMPEQSTLDGVTGFTRRETPADADKVERISIPLTTDGLIDEAAMRPKTLEKLRRALPPTFTNQPTEDEGPNPLAAVFSAKAVGMLYKLLGAVEGRIAAARLPELPKARVQQVFDYSEQDLAILGPPTEAVLAKYTPRNLSKYAEELELAVMLVYVHQTKMQALTDLVQSMAAQQPQGRPVAA